MEKTYWEEIPSKIVSAIPECTHKSPTSALAENQVCSESMAGFQGSQAFSSVKLLLIFLALVSVGYAQSDVPDVWVIGEGMRVDPLTGKLREEQRKDGNPIPADFDYTHKNLAWDAVTDLISLSAARNEVMHFRCRFMGRQSRSLLWPRT